MFFPGKGEMRSKWVFFSHSLWGKGKEDDSFLTLWLEATVFVVEAYSHISVVLVLSIPFWLDHVFACAVESLVQMFTLMPTITVI